MKKGLSKDKEPAAIAVLRKNGQIRARRAFHPYAGRSGGSPSSRVPLIRLIRCDRFSTHKKARCPLSGGGLFLYTTLPLPGGSCTPGHPLALPSVPKADWSETFASYSKPTS